MVITLKKSANSLINQYFPALSHKNYRYFWIGQCISLIGTWMQNMGQSWLVYTLTKSPFLLGLVNTLQFLPVLLFSLFAGALIDIFPKKTILLVTQTASMILALILALLVWTDKVQYWHVLILATLLGLVNTIDMPTRQSFNVEIASKKDLMNAVALNSVIFNAARILGPAIAGFLMAYLGIAFCFFANAISFMAVIFGLTRINVNGNFKPGNGSGILKRMFNMEVLLGVKEGLIYIYKNGILFRTLMSATAVTTFAMNFNVLIPVFAKSVLGQGEKGYGLLMSIMGLGSLIGAVALAVTSKRGPKMFYLKYGTIIISLLLIGIGFNKSYYLTAALLVLVGFNTVSFNATNNSILQINAKDEFRGRVASAYTLINAGSTPIGSLYAGFAADRFGGGMGFIACGFATLIVFILVMWLTRVKSTETIDATNAI
jgi:MFS family permease